MTKYERQRIESFRHIGCIVSGSPQYDVHHLVEGGVRLGHLFTIPLHPWFHRGYDYGHGQAHMTANYGPSLELDKGAFEDKYGTERQLLAKVNRKLKKKAA